MEAKQIIEKFGGQSALARLIGKGQTTVAYWAKTGIIPAKWHETLLSLAAEQGITLVADDFIFRPKISNKYSANYSTGCLALNSRM